jgi:ATP-dependent DNA helicase PIF1
MDPGNGMYEGSRGIVTKIGTRILQLRMLSGDMVMVPKIPVNTTNGIQRLQFPLALAFAMTIEKAQGQTFSAVGIDLRSPCFRHGQLYLALSRANRAAAIKCIVGTTNTEGKTKNIVNREVVSAVS